jgi:hypothetical protein
MTVTLCSRDSKTCQLAQAHDTSAASLPYRVSFGTGVGTLRSREQGLADLYREIRDRTAFGTRLVGVSHLLERPATDGASWASEPVAPPRPSSAEHDPVVDAAYSLMEAVDSEGQVTLDATHSGTTCKLSLAMRSLDGGAGRCLLAGPARPGHESEGVREPRKP